VIQVAAIPPEDRVGSERIPKSDGDRSTQLSFVRIRLQLGQGSGEPSAKILAAQPRISGSGPLGICVMTGREARCVDDGVRWIVLPEFGQAMQDEQGSHFAEGFVEPPVLVPLVTIEVGQDVAELV
jgi:hypothetical protein